MAAGICAGVAPGTVGGGPLTGTWAGLVGGHRMVIVVNARETGGSWQVSATCRGPLTLQSISGGYHHYLRRVAAGSTCAGGDVDCLMRTGARLYDSVTSHRGGAWDVRGTLRRKV